MLEQKSRVLADPILPYSRLQGVGGELDGTKADGIIYTLFYVHMAAALLLANPLLSLIKLYSIL